jgi:hypothetical protein
MLGIDISPLGLGFGFGEGTVWEVRGVVLLNMPLRP